jgi:hypothetical protein
VLVTLSSRVEHQPVTHPRSVGNDNNDGNVSQTTASLQF